MSKPGAVVEILDGYGRSERFHSFVCCHCGVPKIVGPGKKVEDVGDLCRQCGHLHCLSPRCCDGCHPFLKKVEEMEARDASLHSMGLRT